MIKTKTEFRQLFVDDWRMIRFSLKCVHKYNIGVIPTMLALTVVEIITPFINLFFTAKILDALLNLQRREFIYSLVILTIFINLVCYLLRHGLDQMHTYFRTKIAQQSDNSVAEKFTSISYELMENPQTRENYVKYCNYDMWYGGVFMVVEHFFTMVQEGGGLLVSGGMILKLLSIASVGHRGGLLGFIDSPFASMILLGVFLASIVINFRADAHSANLGLAYEKSMESRNSNFFYYAFELPNDYHFGKDIRLYHIAELLNDELDSFFKASHLQRAHYTQNVIKNDSFSIAATTLSFGFSCIFIVMKAILGTITAGAIVMYMGIVANFSSGISRFNTVVSQLHLCSQMIVPFRNIIELTFTVVQGCLPLEKNAEVKYELEFRHVIFRYPASETPVLKDISFKITHGQHLAVVGLNGSGKTTIIKLLCRLYDPSEGEILLNGMDIRNYNLQNYLALLAVVFQDFQLFSFSVGQNVAADRNYDPERIWQCLAQAGIEKRVRSMRQGLETILYSFLDAGGIEISGGEAQKIAIARALYKDAPIIILDEPTASLDPISENEIYAHLNDMIKGKTAIFISHRLSSCRFCDEILVVDEGQIAQRGSHEALLAEESGLYFKMWHTQARYYK